MARPSIGLQYECGEKIAENTSTTVFRASRVADGKHVILKMFHKDKSPENLYRPAHKNSVFADRMDLDSELIPNELFFLEQVMGVSGCVQLLDVLKDSITGNFVLVLEDLTDMGYQDLVQSDIKFDESSAAWIISQLITILQKVHSKGIIHCDIKLDNLFVNFQDGSVKLIDFNFSIDANTSNTVKSSGCTPDYAPPEVYVYRKPWSFAGDIWSLGVLSFVLLCHKFPFDNPYMAASSRPKYPVVTHSLETEGSLAQNLYLPSLPSNLSSVPTTTKFSSQASDFLHGCLCRTPDWRLTLPRLARHAFLRASSAQNLANLCNVEKQGITVK